MFKFRFLVFVVYIFFAKGIQSSQGDFLISSSRLFKRADCVTCDKIALTCQGCKKNEQCTLTTRTCFECPRPKCVKKPEPTSSTPWLTIIIGSVTGGLVLLFVFIWCLFRRRIKKTEDLKSSRTNSLATSVNSSVFEVIDRLVSSTPRHHSVEPTTIISNRKSYSSLNFANFWKKAVPEEPAATKEKHPETMLFTPTEIDSILPPPRRVLTLDSNQNDAGLEKYLGLPPSIFSHCNSSYTISTVNSSSSQLKNDVSADLKPSDIALLKLSDSLAQANLSPTCDSENKCNASLNVLTSNDSPLPSPITINPPLENQTQNIEFGFTSVPHLASSKSFSRSRSKRFSHPYTNSNSEVSTALSNESLTDPYPNEMQHRSFIPQSNVHSMEVEFLLEEPGTK